MKEYASKSGPVRRDISQLEEHRLEALASDHLRPVGISHCSGEIEYIDLSHRLLLLLFTISSRYQSHVRLHLNVPQTAHNQGAGQSEPFVSPYT